MTKFLHITKTAGTALKNTLKDHPNGDFMVFRRHDKILKHLTGDVGFVVRDPWKRFASGFWERKTLDLIRQVRLDTRLLPLKYATGGMGIDYSPYEIELFDHANTPDDLITYFQENKQVIPIFDSYKMDTPDNNIGQLCASYVYWLGTLNEYKKQEYKIKIAVDIESLSTVMKNEFNVQMNEDPYIARTRAQFNISQSYEVSEKNLEWFKEWRCEDYKLVEYIKTRPYYRSSK